MNISPFIAAYQVNQLDLARHTSQSKVTKDTPNSNGDTVTISEEARKAQSSGSDNHEPALMYFPESVRNYFPDCCTLDIAVGKYGPVNKQMPTFEQISSWPEYSNELFRVYNACMEKHGLSGGLELEQMSSQYQEDFAKDLHQMFADDPDKERIQELMTTLDVQVENL